MHANAFGAKTFLPNSYEIEEHMEKMGLLKEEDIFRALAVEFDLGDFDFHSPPWRKDEELT